LKAGKKRGRIHRCRRHGDGGSKTKSDSVKVEKGSGKGRISLNESTKHFTQARQNVRGQVRPAHREGGTPTVSEMDQRTDTLRLHAYSNIEKPRVGGKTKHSAQQGPLKRKQKKKKKEKITISLSLRGTKSGVI